MNNKYIVLMKDVNGVQVKHEVEAASEYKARIYAEQERDDCMAISARQVGNKFFRRGRG
jgi:hypothetical protein